MIATDSIETLTVIMSKRRVASRCRRKGTPSIGDNGRGGIVRRDDGADDLPSHHHKIYALLVCSIVHSRYGRYLGPCLRHEGFPAEFRAVDFAMNHS
jgi:hypothetical protein